MNRTTNHYVVSRERFDKTYCDLARLSQCQTCLHYAKNIELMRATAIRIIREGVRPVRRHDGLQVAQKGRKLRVLNAHSECIEFAPGTTSGTRILNSIKWITGAGTSI